jgi:molybdate transport system ATP-binding protein
MSLSVDITKKYKNFQLSVKFETSGNTIGILGASGCGKSMTLKAIAGIIAPDSGRIALNGRILFDSERKINLPPQKRRIGYLFQSYALFPNMTVEQNIKAGMTGNRDQKDKKTRTLIDKFHLKGLEKHYPGQLSGGQQQRVALARIMASDTDVLLLDEPFSALDFFLKEQLEKQLQDMLRDYNKNVILVTHNRDEAFRFCQDLYIMDKGNMVCSGKLKDIFRDPGYLIAARLTGCKNISRAERISSHELYAKDWNMKLQATQEISEDIRYVGIRAHFLEALSHKSDGNIMEPEVVDVTEEPFEVNVMFRNKNNEHSSAEHTIWWKLPKDRWSGEFGSRAPEFLRFPPEHILLLKGTDIGGLDESINSF